MYVLVCELVVCMAAYLGLRWWNDTAEDRVVDDKTYLAQLEDITSLTWQRSGETLSFEKDEEGVWHDVSDADFPLDQSYLTALETTLSQLSAVKVISDPEEDSSYGLDAPDLTLTATAADGESLEITVGSEVDGNYYARPAGDSQVYTIAAALMTVTGALLFAFPGQMMSLFTEDAQVIDGGSTVLRIVAVSEPMFAALIIFEGVFNGIGDTRAPFVFSIISMWGVRIAGTCLCVIFLHAGLELVWVCMVGDNVTRCLLLGHRFVKGSRSKDRSWKKRFVSVAMKESEK